MKLPLIRAIMKQDNVRKMTSPMRSVDQKQPTKRSGLWRIRSSSEAPSAHSSSAPRSPITKAFDLLPWSRGKRYAEIKAKSPSPEALKISNAIQVNDRNEPSSSMHFHRNIFRSGGNSIRDIIAERLHKGKENSIASNYNSSYHNNKSYGKQKGIITRNKSLDINELISNVQNNLTNTADINEGHVNAIARQNGSKQNFLDDTFVENMWREKIPDSRCNSNDSEYDDDGVNGDERYSEIYDPENVCNEEHENASKCPLRSSFHTIHSGSSSGGSKHILFNDENVVYLIKKELPVIRHDASIISEPSKSPKKPSSERSKNTNINNSNSNSTGDHNNVLRARLKFKKVPTESNKNTKTNAISTSWNHRKQILPLNVESNQIRNYQKIEKNSNNNSAESVGTMEPKRRGILQRQNTSPTIRATRMNLIPSPMLGDDQIQDRRKSFSEAILNGKYQQTPSTQSQHVPAKCHQPQQQHQKQQPKSSHFDHSSSSSSMGSAVSNERAQSVSGVALEPLQPGKPRKKLSFREPVVSEKVRRRSLSSPLQQTNSEAGFDWKSGENGATPRREISNNQFALKNPNSLDIIVSEVDAESQAMRIVRTVGQAFEVCHKFKFNKNSVDRNDERSDVSSELLDVENCTSEQQVSDKDTNNRAEPPASTSELSNVHSLKRPNHLELMPRTSPSTSMEDDKSLVTPSSPSHEIINLKDQLEQQTLQTRQALAQLMLVREQLISETNARIEAQARTQQLLQQNRELLEHLASLGVYNEQQTAGLTSANIAMAPQSQLQMLLQATSANNNLATINQQISNLGSINQQLTSLSHQLSGLNQQSQNLQNLQNIQNMNATTLQQQQQLSPQQQTEKIHSPQQQSNIAPLSSLLNTPNTATTLSSNTSFPSINQLRTISNQLQQINAQATQQQLQQDALSKDLVQVNQDLLNRLQALNLGGTAAAAAVNPSAVATTPNNSFFFVNPMSCSPQTTTTTTANNNNNNNNISPSNFNFLNSSNSLLNSGIGYNNSCGGSGNLTPSPMSTLNRNSYTHSPITELEGLRLSVDKNLNRIDEFSLLTTALGQRLPSIASNSNIANATGGGVTSGRTSTATTSENSRSTSTIDSQSSPRSTNEQPLLFNTVTLKVTDEAGNVTNQRRLSATPSFITRSTSEKVPNRSQMMSEVQRTTWARHTTK